MKLLGERILVKKVESGSKIILPDKVMTEEIVVGEVVELGNRINGQSGCDEIRVGDIVRWSVYAGQWAEIENKVVCILRPNDIICILDKVRLN